MNPQEDDGREPLLVAQAGQLTEALRVNLRREIAARGLRLLEVGARLGVSGFYISQLLRGGFDLRWVHVLEILRVVGLSPAEFCARLHPLGEATQVEVVRQALLRVVAELGHAAPTALAAEAGAPSSLPSKTSSPMAPKEENALQAEADGPMSEWSVAASADIARSLLRQLRSQGISQLELSRRVSLARTYVGKLLRGEKNLKVKHFYLFCLALDIEPGALLGELWPVPHETDPQERIAALVDTAIRALSRPSGGKDFEPDPSIR